MADNVVLDAGSGGDTIAADDVGGVKIPRGKIVIGADGVSDGDVSASNPLPVKGTGTAGTANAGVVTVQGIASMTPVQVADNGGSLTVDGTVAATQSGTWSLRLQDGSGNAIASQADNTDLALTDSGLVTRSVMYGYDDAAQTYKPVWVQDDGNLSVVVQQFAASLAVTNAGTFAVQAAQSGTWTVTGAGGTFPVTGTFWQATQPVSLASVPSHAVTNAGTFAVQAAGDVAADAVDSGNPVKQGFLATTSLSGLTLVANADRANGMSGIDGVQVTRPHSNLEDIVTGNASNTDGTSTQLIAAQAAGVKTYLTSVILTNTSSSNIYVEIKDGTTVKVTIPLPANSGAIFNPPVPLPGTAATAWNFDPSAAATTVICSAIGFKSKV